MPQLIPSLYVLLVNTKQRTSQKISKSPSSGCTFISRIWIWNGSLICHWSKEKKGFSNQSSVMSERGQQKALAQTCRHDAREWEKYYFGEQMQVATSPSSSMRSNEPVGKDGKTNVNEATNSLGKANMTDNCSKMTHGELKEAR